MGSISRREFGASVAVVALSGTYAWTRGLSASAPAEVLLIRHGEEQDRKPDEHLNAAGRTRAEKLIALFPAQFPLPTHLFAAKSSKASHRSVETLGPLAASLRLKIDDRFEDNQYRQLAADILSKPRYANARILICWQHGQLPKLATALGANNAPSVWPGPQFDHVWRLEYAGGAVKFSDVPQRFSTTT